MVISHIEVCAVRQTTSPYKGMWGELLPGTQKDVGNNENVTTDLQSRLLNSQCNVPRLSAQSMDATCTLSPTSTVCLIFFSKARTLHSRSVRTRVPVGAALVLCNLTVTKLASLLTTCKPCGSHKQVFLAANITRSLQVGVCKYKNERRSQPAYGIGAHTYTHMREL